MRAFLMFTVLAVAVPDRPDPTPKDAKPPREQILGDWLCEKIEFGKMGGTIEPSNDVRVFRITPSETVFLINGKPSPGDGLTAAYSIDWSKNPVAIDFMPRGRNGKMTGILRLEGDRLTLGLRTSGDARLIDFNSADLVGHYKRIQK
jgi:uncharacterized protein (TIGR03067 family)